MRLTYGCLLTILCAATHMSLTRAAPEVSFYEALVAIDSPPANDSLDIARARPIEDVGGPVVPISWNSNAAASSWVGTLYDIGDSCNPNSTAPIYPVNSLRHIPILKISTCPPVPAFRIASIPRPEGIIIYSPSSDNSVDPSLLEYTALPIVQIESKIAATVINHISNLQATTDGTAKWMGYVVVGQAQAAAGTTTARPNVPNTSMDVGLLWQFGLALVGGILFFGIPCTCLLSWWARRRMEAAGLTMNGLEEHTNPETTHNPTLMKETDMDLFPIKPYHHNHFKRQPRSITNTTAAESEPASPAEPDSHTESASLSNLHKSTVPDSSLTLYEHPTPRPSTDTGKDAKSTETSSEYSLAYSFDSCPICLDTFQEGEPIRELPCQHYFHNNCIEPWLTKRNSICPMCRINLLETVGGSAGGVDEVVVDVEGDPREQHGEIPVESPVSTHPNSVPAEGDQGMAVPMYDLSDRSNLRRMP